MVKKLFLFVLIFSIQAMAYASPFIQPEMYLSTILKGWSQSMRQPIEVELPYKVLSRKDVEPRNLEELSYSISNINEYLLKLKLTPIHACVFSDIIVITTIDNKNCELKNK